MSDELWLRGKIWYTDVPDANGKRIRESCKTSDKKLAEKRLAQLKTEIFEDRFTSKSSKRNEMTLEEAFTKTMKTHWMVETKTFKTVQYNWDRLKGTLVEGRWVDQHLDTTQKLSAISRAALLDVVESLRGAEYSSASINRSMAVLKTILIKARDDWEVLDKIPKVPTEKESKGRLRWLQEGEEEVITGWFRDRGDIDMAEFIEVLLDTGCRVSEILGLTSDTVKLFNKRILLWDTKNGEWDFQTFSTERTLQIFTRRYKLAGSPFEGLTRHAAIHRFQTMKKHCGFESDTELCLHTMRHTTASRLVEKGMDLKRVQEFMRHKDINTTLRYAKLNTEEKAKTGQALEKSSVPSVTKVCQIGA